MRIIVFLTLLLGCVFSTQAIVDPPKLLRACLNGSDSVVTLLWEPPTDACGSFTEYHIYGRENSGPIIWLATEKSLSTDNIQIKLPSADFKWNFYIETLHTCNGTDSVRSNVIWVDKVAPVYQDIDSVSVDRVTQTLVVGWKKNPHNDVKWYRIYEKLANTNSRIDDTVGLQYLFKQHSITTPISLRLAAFDSCDQPGPLSDEHSHMILSHNVDTCDVSIALNWSAYVGWNQVDKYELHYSTNGSAFGLETATNSTSYTFRNFVLGDDVCFFIRAIKSGGERITSSSSEVCANTRAPVKPTIDYLETVSVDGQNIQIEWRSTGSSDVQTFELMRDDGAGESVVTTTPGSTLSSSYSDPAVLVDQQSHIYTVQTRDYCNKVLSRSNTSRSIFLELNKPILSWTDYVGWAGSVQEYVVESFDGSTWNIVASTNNNSYTLDTSYFRTSVCLRVRAIETGNPLKDAESLSNQVCTEGEFTFYVPNAMNPQNPQNYFKVVGTNVDYSQSTAIILNRWGEKIVEVDDLSTGWDGTYQGEQLPLGIYYYTVKVYSLNGVRKERKGYIRIIR